jgi:hypothetical protein
MTPAQQHRYEVWASELLYATFTVSFIADFILGCGYFAPHKSMAQYFMLFGANPLLLFIYYKIRQGVKGAKTLFLTLYAFVLLQLMSEGLSPTSYDTPLEAANLLVQHGLQVGACVLLLLSMHTPSDAPATELLRGGNN